ncbi:hypothetical protein HPB51_019519 [Rhipicephalus microplus]|uniref:Ran gtpase-activating protein n=1 Tax=Rhipicephalus microplus TaxID=6941 RepID=A0A9J6EAR0_RHIMP|nr:hypothetical protein HPB51_019519 [Rhipicephalus microplus]
MLQVNGSTRKSPTALLAAVAQSHSLQWLTLVEYYIDPADIEALAADLAIPSQFPKLGAEVIGPAPTSRLQKLHLTNCGPFTSRLEEARAKLIGGVLVELKLGQCGLNEVFASLAAKRLLHDQRLRELNLEDNNFSMKSIRSIVEVLQVNKRLKALVLNMTMHYLEEDVTSLFDMIHRIDAFSRLWIHWVFPRASEFTKCILTARTPSVSICLNDYGAEEAAEALGAIARCGNLDYVSLRYSEETKEPVLQKLADTLASTKSLKKVPLISYLLFPGCGGCISDGGGNVVGACTQIWVHVKEPQVVKISGALHYGVSHNHMVVLAR